MPDSESTEERRRTHQPNANQNNVGRADDDAGQCQAISFLPAGAITDLIARHGPGDDPNQATDAKEP